jgi:ankyrin repeat protein
MASRYVVILQLVICFMVMIMNTTQASADAKALETQFLQAASKNNSATVITMLAQGVDIESRDKSGRSALLLATHHNAIDVVRVLIEAGADVNAMDDIDDSPYLYAGAEGPIEILRMTLKHGADLGSVNRYGGTALIPAAHHGHVEIVRELLKTKVDIDHVNHLGWTALLEAIILGDGGPVYIKIVDLLIEAGADINISDDDGVLPLTHANNRGYTEIADLLSAVNP